MTKPRALNWRVSHPYFLVDRIEDLTSREDIRKNSKCDRTVAVYGYLRGANLRTTAASPSLVHIAGVADWPIASCVQLPDPCPLPDTIKKRRLDEKEQMLYAPMSDVGDLLFDKDALYINLDQVHFTRQDSDKAAKQGLGGGDEEEDEEEEEEAEKTTGKNKKSDTKVTTKGVQLVRDLQDLSDTIDEKLSEQKIQLFKGGAELSGEGHGQQYQVVQDRGRHRRRVVFDDEAKQNGEAQPSRNHDSANDKKYSSLPGFFFKSKG